MLTFIAEYRDDIGRNTIYKVFFITANTMRGAKAKATRVCPVAYHGSYIDLYALVNGAYVKVSTQGTYGWTDVEVREEPTYSEERFAQILEADTEEWTTRAVELDDLYGMVLVEGTELPASVAIASGLCAVCQLERGEIPNNL